MKKIVGILMMFSIIACQNNETAATISGTAKGVKDGTKIFASALGENNMPVPLDTAVVKNEKFTLELPDPETQTLNSLKLENTRGNVFFIHEDTAITFELYKDSLRTSKVVGGKNNALLMEYTHHLTVLGKEMNNLMNQFRKDPANRQNPAKIKEFQGKRQAIIEENAAFQKELVKNNPNSIVAVMALSDLMRSNSLTYLEKKEMFERLSSEVQNTALGKKIEDQLKTASATAVGNKAPKFSGPTPEGDTLALEDAMGKITLVDFWASWCKPCRKENPNIVRVYKKYHDQGLNIIGVSLDKSKAKWVEAIKADGLPWNHVSHLKYWRGPIAQKYGIRSIPAAFLLDENGVIVAKDLRGEELEKKVAELLGAAKTAG